MPNRANPAPVPRFPLAAIAAARRTAVIADALAAARDADGGFPDTEVDALAQGGLLHAPLPPEYGGFGLGMDRATAGELRDVLRIIGGASLPLGRLYEGHVNAIRLVTCYGGASPLAVLADEADAGRLSAVWNAELPPGLRFDGTHLSGSKRYTSGAGHVRRPLVTAAGPSGHVMLLPDVRDAATDLSAWRPTGMAASATGSIDFTGIAVPAAVIVGTPGDYYRAPLFAGGAWRVLAVQLGALDRLVALYAEALNLSGKSGDPVQRARFGTAAATLETARLWTARAADIAETDHPDTDTIVNLARYAFERAALDIIELVQRGIGLSAMLRPSPVERIARDLLTYLRQPFPDAALDAAAAALLSAPRDPHHDLGC